MYCPVRSGLHTRDWLQLSRLAADELLVFVRLDLEVEPSDPAVDVETDAVETVHETGYGDLPLGHRVVPVGLAATGVGEGNQAVAAVDGDQRIAVDKHPA